MMEEFLMKIGFIFRDGEKGKRIVGGADSKYSCKDLKWLNILDKRIVIKASDRDVFLKV